MHMHISCGGEARRGTAILGVRLEAPFVYNCTLIGRTLGNRLALRARPFWYIEKTRRGNGQTIYAIPGGILRRVRSPI